MTQDTEQEQEYEFNFEEYESGQDELYLALSSSVGEMRKLPSGSKADYHDGEQIIRHLNRVLGPGHWKFVVLSYGFDEDADEAWVYGQLDAFIDGIWVPRQDFGSQALKRSKQTGVLLSKYDDLKGALTDCVKRTARLFSVGLDAWEKAATPPYRRTEQDADQEFQRRQQQRQGGQQPRQVSPAARNGTGSASSQPQQQRPQNGPSRSFTPPFHLVKHDDPHACQAQGCAVVVVPEETYTREINGRAVEQTGAYILKRAGEEAFNRALCFEHTLAWIDAKTEQGVPLVRDPKASSAA